MLRILLADDHSVVRRIVRNFVQSESGWEVCAEATTGREAVVMTAAEHPDVVVLDLSMPDLNGLQAATLIHNQFPEMQLILLTMHDSLELTDQLTASGVRACIRKDDLNQLVEAIRSACHPEPKLS
jgi:DNA-binding NarL/FixJ family response regulator